MHSPLVQSECKVMVIWSRCLDNNAATTGQDDPTLPRLYPDPGPEPAHQLVRNYFIQNGTLLLVTDIVNMLRGLALVLVGLTTVHGLGQQQCLYFPESSNIENRADQVVFDSQQTLKHDFILASSDKGSDSIPILTSSKDNVAVHLAVASFISDVEKVTGARMQVYNDTLPGHSQRAVIVGTSSSEVVKDLKGYQGVVDDLEGKWESFDIRVLGNPKDGLKEAMVISGSDRVSKSLLSLDLR